jgi:transcriptional regulator with XRE-family HTH domain
MKARTRRPPTYWQGLLLPSFCAPALRRARLEAGLTQAQVAKRIGCSANLVWRWEQDFPHVSESTVYRYAAVLGLTPKLVLERPTKRR